MFIENEKLLTIKLSDAELSVVALALMDFTSGTVEELSIARTMLESIYADMLSKAK